MKKIKILYYEPSSGYGGSSRCLLSWLKELDRNKFKPYVIAHYQGPAIKAIMDLGVKTQFIPLKSLYLNKTDWLKKCHPVLSHCLLLYDFIFFVIPVSLLIFFIAKRESTDLLHLNTRVMGVIPGIIASRLLRKPCIVHLHEMQVPIRREKFFASWVSCFIVLTEKALCLYKKEYLGKRIELIPNGIDINEFDCQVNKDKYVKEFDISNKLVVGIVGRLVEGKGHVDFIEAALWLKQNMKDKKVKFLIVGSAAEDDVKYEIYLKKIVSEKGLSNDIIFTGWREDAKKIIEIFDVCVQASSTFPEGFGLTCIESMARRKPVVVTNIPGPSEIIENGKTGIIVPVANPVRMANGIRFFLENELERRKFGKRGRESVEAMFNIVNLVKKLEIVYEEFLENK